MSRSAVQAVAVLVLLALLGWHVHARLKPEADLNVADRALLGVTGPVQKVLNGGVSGVGGFFENYVMLVGVSKENEDLLRALAEAEARNVEMREVAAENDRLREMIGLQSRAPGKTAPATVIGRGTSARFRTLRIDKGTVDGVEPDMAVLGIQGAVGKILRASGHYADVLLITDGLSSVGSVVQRSRARAVSVGDGDGGLELGYIRRSDLSDVSEGDLVVTSGEDGVFPEGVPLGVVTVASAPESGLFVEASIEPSVPLDRIEEVLVVTDSGSGPFHHEGLTIIEPLVDDEDLLAAPWGPPLLEEGQR